MMISRIVCVVIAAVLVDAAAASFAGSPLVRWSTIAAAALFAALAAVSWRRFAPIAAGAGALVIAATIAAGGWADAGGGLRFTGLDSDASVALAIVLVLAGCAVAVAVSRLPVAVRVTVPIVELLCALPFGRAVYGGTLDAAFSGTLGWLAWAAVMIALPLAALAAVAAAVAMAALRRWTIAVNCALIGLAFLACAQAGAREAGNRGKPSWTAFEGTRTTPAISEVSSSAATSGSAPAKQSTSGIIGNAQMTALGGTSGANEAFGGSPPPGGDYALLAMRARTQAETFPRAAYDLDAVAATLPADPTAIFHFVRDHVATDVYPGALRGARGAIMAWSANPTDRALLLAALLHEKGIDSQFVHATLSDAEAAQIVALDGKPASGAPSPEGVVATPAPNATMSAYVSSTLAAAEQQAQAISSALASNGAPLATAGGAPSIDDVRSHWWVRAAVNGQAIDLDPSLPTLESGAHLGTADGAPASADLPDNEYVTMRFHVVAVTSANGSPRTSDVIDRTVRVADLVGVGVHLWMVPSHNGDDPRTAGALDPSLGIGQSVYAAAPLEMKPADGSQLDEVRFEITTQQPRRAPRTYRRWLLAPGNAHAGAPAAHIAGSYDLMVQTGPENPVYVAAQMLQSMAGIYTFEAVNATNTGARSVVDLPLPLHVLAFQGRDGYFMQRVAENANVRFVVDRPQIAMQRLDFGAASEGAPEARSTFDIVEDGLAAYGNGAPHANLVRGVVSTAIERDLANAPQQGAYDLLSAGARDGSMTRLIRAAPDASDPQQRGIAETIANGGIALALNGSSALGGETVLAWWDVDPASGNAIGRITGGTGAALVERALILVNVIAYGMSVAADLNGCHGAGCLCPLVVDTFFFLAGFKMNLGATIVTLPVSVSVGFTCGPS